MQYNEKYRLVTKNHHVDSFGAVFGLSLELSLVIKNLLTFLMLGGGGRELIWVNFFSIAFNLK